MHHFTHLFISGSILVESNSFLIHSFLIANKVWCGYRNLVLILFNVKIRKVFECNVSLIDKFDWIAASFGFSRTKSKIYYRVSLYLKSKNCVLKYILLKTSVQNICFFFLIKCNSNNKFKIYYIFFISKKTFNLKIYILYYEHFIQQHIFQSFASLVLEDVPHLDSIQKMDCN